MSLRKIITADGKYTTTNDNGSLKVYRYESECPEVWREEDLIGDGYVLSLVHRIEELEDALLEINNKYNGQSHEITWNVMCALNSENVKLKEAIQYFVARVECGEIRSTKTYAMFKDLLGETE